MLKSLLDTDYPGCCRLSRRRYYQSNRPAARFHSQTPDCLIAATVVRLQMPLVTGNTEDFRAIQRTGINLVIENWREM